MASAASGTGWRPLALARRTWSSSEASPFERLALTHALVTAGDAMVTVALAGSLFFSISPTAARTRVALSLVLTMLPFGVVAPFLGPAIDRSRVGRRVMLAAAAAGRVFAALAMAREIHSLLVFPMALILLILSKTHAVLKASLVPATVDRPTDLVRANSRLALLGAIVGITAAGPAAAILKLVGGRWVLGVASVLYGMAALAAVRLRTATAPENDVTPQVSPTAATLLDRGVGLAAMSMAVLRGVVGFLTFAVAFEFRRAHTASWWYGLVIGASLAGNFAGSLLGPSLRRFLHEERILVLSLWLVTVAGVFAGRADSRPAMAVLAMMVGLAAGTGRLVFDAIVQRDRAERARARSFARFEATFQLAWVAAALLPVVVAIPLRVASLMIASATAVAGIFSFTGRRALRRASSASPGAG